MTAGDWYSKPDRPRQTFGHFDTTAIADDETRLALERIKFELEQLNRGCETPVYGLRAHCWSPDVTRPQYGYYMAGFNQLVLSSNLRVTSETNRRQIMLPDAVQRPGGQCWVVDYDGDAATNPVTIGTIKGQKINGADTFSINQNYGAVQFTSTGTDWRAVSNAQGGSSSPGGGDFLADGSVPLTNYVDWTEISEPTDPGANILRLWAEDNNGFSFPHLKDDNGTAIELARDSVHVVRNNTGGTLTTGTVVYVNGSTGVVPTVAKARANSASTMPAWGIVKGDISDASFGLVIRNGDVDGFDTSAFNDGDELFVSETTAGALTATEPTGSGEFTQRVGTVIKAAAGSAGIISVEQTVSRPVLGDLATQDTVGIGDYDTGSVGTTVLADLAVTNAKVNASAAIALTKLANISNDRILGRTAGSSGPIEELTFGDVFGESKLVVLQYTGSGSSGKTVTLTGINRAHYIRIMRVGTATVAPNTIIPDGATGTVTRRNDSTGQAAADVSLNAPAAGTSQVLTINNTFADDNTSGQAYYLAVWGTPI